MPTIIPNPKKALFLAKKQLSELVYDAVNKSPLNHCLKLSNGKFFIFTDVLFKYTSASSKLFLKNLLLKTLTLKINLKINIKLKEKNTQWCR
jgi:hypothetical protein